MADKPRHGRKKPFREPFREPSAPGYWCTHFYTPSRGPTARGPKLLGFITITSLVLPFAVAHRAPAQEQKPEPSGLALATAVEQTLIDVIARCEKSVVAIARVKVGADRPTIGIIGPRNPFGRPRPRFPTIAPTNPRDPNFIPYAYGTGVVIDARGLILTEYHVVGENDDHWVTTADGKVYRAAIKAADPRSGLAVLSIPANGLVPIRFGDARRVRKGQIVITLGNPYAIARDGHASASWGIVANIARKAGPLPQSEFFQPDTTLKPTLHHFGTLIQTDAKLNLGTSGGALVNLHGEMIGLTTSQAALAGYEQAAGYAVPMNPSIRRVIEVLKEGREVEHGLLGISWSSSRRFSTTQPQQGVRVQQVWPGTPAHLAGLRTGDVITHIDGEAVNDMDSLMLKIGQRPAATKIRLRYYRRDGVHEVEVRLAKFPVVGTKIATRHRPSWRGLHIDYATVVAAYEDYVRRGEIDYHGCVLITKVDVGSPAWRQGLRAKMFVSHVENRRVTDPSEFLQAVAGRQGPVRLRLTLPADQQPVRTIPTGT